MRECSFAIASPEYKNDMTSTVRTEANSRGRKMNSGSHLEFRKVSVRFIHVVIGSLSNDGKNKFMDDCQSIKVSGPLVRKHKSDSSTAASSSSSFQSLTASQSFSNSMSNGKSRATFADSESGRKQARERAR